MMLKGLRASCLGLLAVLALAACVSTDTMKTTREFSPLERDAVILVVEPDVELSFLKAAGVSEVRADWTESGKERLLGQMEAFLAERGHSMQVHEIDPADEREVQIVKLHEVVGNTILRHRYFNQPLPSKRGQFDWSLGPGVADLAEPVEADYALFLYARGQYASAGRQALSVGLILLGGGSVSTGGQAAFASLVDMRTGDVVWFNIAQTSAGTDMREPDGAERLVKALFREAPL